MNRLSVCLAMALICAFESSSALAQTKPAEPGASAGKPYVYKRSDGKSRTIELFFPPNHDAKKAKAPGLILIHGGGWSGGTPAQFRRACAYFASRGMVTATVQYRMLTKDEAGKLPPGESRKRVCVTDAKSAIRWMKSHAEELGIDPARIVTGGGSAGGHVSVLATTNPGLDDPTDPKEQTTSVIAYLLFNPAFTPDDAADREVDALAHVTEKFAPAIVFFGSEDRWKTGWNAVFEKLKSAGNAGTEVFLAKGQPHGFFNKDPWQTLTLIEADRFLARLGILTGESTIKPPPASANLVREAPISKSPAAKDAVR